MTRDTGFVVSEASYRCRSAIPSARCVSSRENGWASLLVDVHSGIQWNETYAAVVTADPRIGVSLSGNYVSQYYSNGLWRHDVYRAGTTTILRSDSDRRFRFVPLTGTDCEFALVYFPLEGLVAAAEHLRRPGQPSAPPLFHQILAEDPALLEVSRALIAAMRAGADEVYAGTVGAWLAAHILARSSIYRSNADMPGSVDLSDRRLRRVIDFMRARFSEPLTLEQLADEAGISKFHFARLFRQKTGHTAHGFLTGIRLSAAESLLLETDMRVGEIAHSCGYAGGAQFTKAFVRRFGTSPTRYRAAR